MKGIEKRIINLYNILIIFRHSKVHLFKADKLQIKILGKIDLFSHGFTTVTITKIIKLPFIKFELKNKRLRITEQNRLRNRCLLYILRRMPFFCFIYIETPKLSQHVVTKICSRS